MTQNASNHPGQTHSGAKDRSAKTKKQFVRIEGQPRIYWIHADDDIWDTKLHLTGKPLVCPDRGCHQKMKASQRKAAPYTKYLSDMNGTKCSHFVPKGGGGRTTEEHLWLQGFIRQICEELGYPATLETDFADIKVEAERNWAIEVQRVSTDFSKREDQRKLRGMETLWLLPESAQRSKNTGSSGGGDPLFSTPAVRLLYRFAGQRGHEPNEKYLREHVWANKKSAKVELRVAATLWTVAPQGQHVERVETSMPLRDFLREVLSGGRRWHPRSQLVPYTSEQSGWAGWIRDDEFEIAKAARKEREARRAEEELRWHEEQDRREREEEERIRSEEVERRRSEQSWSKTEEDWQGQGHGSALHSDEGADLSLRESDCTPKSSVGKEGAPGADCESMEHLGVQPAKPGASSDELEPWWRRAWNVLTRR